MSGQQSVQVPAVLPMLLTVTETCAHLRISRWTFYRLVNERRLRTVQIQRRRFVSVDAVAAFVRELETGDR